MSRLHAAAPTTRHASCATSLGTIWLARSAKGLLQVQVGGDEAQLLTQLDRRRAGGSRLDPEALEADITALTSWLDGEVGALDMPLDLDGLPDFTRRVLSELRRVPRGVTCSYGELASKVGSPGAARAIGQVMNRNPLPIVIPCHRVVASDGIGGFGCGLDAKRALLKIEGVTRFNAPSAVPPG